MYYITLDDMSDNYKKHNNIYLKLGLHYIMNDEEMKGNLRHILYG